MNRQDALLLHALDHRVHRSRPSHQPGVAGTPRRLQHIGPSHEAVALQCLEQHGRVRQRAVGEPLDQFDHRVPRPAAVPVQRPIRRLWLRECTCRLSVEVLTEARVEIRHVSVVGHIAAQG